MSFQDTRERIFVNGQIYSRPRFGGRVHGPDTRQFTPDPNPYDVEPETPRYGQGSVGFADTNQPRIRQHHLDPSTPEERERFRILEGRGPLPSTEGLDPFSPNPFGDALLDYLNELQRDHKFKDLLFRPTDTFDIRKPVYRPEDKVEVLPLKVSANYTTVDPSDLPEAVELRRKSEDFFQEMNPNPSIDPSKLDLREYRQPGPYRPGEDLHKDQFILSPRSPIASNPETGKRDFLYQYLEQNKEVMGPKNQMFGRYADPDDGTLIAADVPAIGPEIPQRLVGDVTERIVPGYKERRDALRKRIAGILRGV